MMVKIYGMPGCKQCKEAVAFCEAKGIEYVYIDDQEKLIELAKLAGIPRMNYSFTCLRWLKMKK